MSSPNNEYWTDTSVLPSDILSLQNYDFFRVVKDLTNEIVADLLSIQAIRNVRIFLLVPDVFDVIRINAAELEAIKSRACFRLKNDTYVVKIGIELSLRYLRDLFTAKIQESYHASNNQQTPTSNHLPLGQKRSASSSEQIWNKRGRQ